MQTAKKVFVMKTTNVLKLKGAIPSLTFWIIILIAFGFMIIFLVSGTDILDSLSKLLQFVFKTP